MKQLFLLMNCVLLIHFGFSQNQIRKEDSVCALLRKAVNDKNTAQLYALCGTTFKKQMPEEAFRNFCENNLFPIGQITEMLYESNTGSLFRYKAVYPGLQLTVLIALDVNAKIESLIFKPYTKEVAMRNRPVPSTNALKTALDSSVDRVAQEYLANANTVGLSLAILLDGKTYFYNYGETVRGNGQLPDKDTYFEIGSISKTFTATLLAEAVLTKKLNLDDAASKYLPDSVGSLSYQGQPITLKTLSNQSSGIPPLPGNLPLDSESLKNPYKAYDESALFSFYKNFSPVRAPGAEYEYSNLAVGTLGTILERVEKKSYEELVTEKICKPLGMLHTKQFLHASDSLHFAAGYKENGQYNPPWDFKALAGAGALRSTAADLIIYARANLGESPKILYGEMQLTHQISFSSKEAVVGLGWHYIRPAKNSILFHNGGTGGYRSYLGIDLQRKYAVVVLSNSAISVDGVGNNMMAWLETN